MAEEPQDPIEDLLPGYALNALEPDEYDRVEAALEREPRYLALLADYLEAAAALSTAHQPAVPSAALRDRVLGHATADAAPKAGFALGGGGSRVPLAFWGVAAAFLIAAFGLGSLSVLQQQRVGELEAEMDALTVEAAETENMIQEQRDLTALAVQPGVSRASLQSRVPEPSSSREAASVVWLKDEQGTFFLMAMGLPVPPDGFTYQAWLLDGDEVHSVGMFDVDETGYALIPAWIQPESDNVRRLWITVESEGGALAPTAGRPLMWGRID
jgi:anti-sigma-K factor RskA